jgi:hypothetical protein
MKRLSVLMGILLLSLLLWQEARGQKEQSAWEAGLGKTLEVANQSPTGIWYAPLQWSVPLMEGAKPKPNQCPACGTMAKPYHPVTTYCGDYSSGQPMSALGLAGCEPKMSITRCKRCNAAFWQDAASPSAR